MKDSKDTEKLDTKEQVNEIENEVELEEKPKTPSIPAPAKYTRPPAFERWNNSFARWNQNNFKPVQRRAAQRWR